MAGVRLVIDHVAHASVEEMTRSGFVSRRIATTIVLVIFTATLVIRPSHSFAQDAKTQAAELSDHAFAMLNAINASSAKAGPILAPAANLAGAAQTLST
ncbi:MAG TPA: hypothetical protein VE243_13000, partial [Candidatus Acidoferrum sp.]|nr:hypothetical protein [Candidatus Acidoferrum sp.]